MPRKTKEEGKKKKIKAPRQGNVREGKKKYNNNVHM